MNRYTYSENLKNALSPYDIYCDGYGNSGSSGNSYILGMVIGVGKTNISFSHPGSQILDEINAFDLSEVDGPYIGQLNMSIVSSFCGPQGLIWGYDVVPAEDVLNDRCKKVFDEPVECQGETINVYDANVLIDSTEKLLGNVNEKRFILRPGAHVPFAGKNKIFKGHGTIYAAIAIGIPKNRQDNACLLLEDIGTIKSVTFETTQDTIFTNLAKSIITIGKNQHVEYSDCFIAIRTCEIGSDQIGCALVAAPYLTLAKNAVIKNMIGVPDMQKMFNASTSEWEKAVLKK